MIPSKLGNILRKLNNKRSTKMKKILLIILIFPSLLWAERHEVSITNNKFTPNNLEIKVGDSVRWTNNQGFHDVRADNNSFTSGPPSSAQFVFERTFDSVEEIFYYCTVHSAPGRNINAFMNGRINVTSNDPIEPPAEPEFIINQGISGAWFFPETSGSGLLLDIRPSDQFIFVAWFTYNEESFEKIGVAENRWFTASGNYENGIANEIPMFQTSGGIFDNPKEVSSIQVGTMTLDFSDCNTAIVTYNFTDPVLSGEFPIQRVIPGTQQLCEDLSTPTNIE